MAVSRRDSKRRDHENRISFKQSRRLEGRKATNVPEMNSFTSFPKSFELISIREIRRHISYSRKKLFKLISSLVPLFFPQLQKPTMSSEWFRENILQKVFEGIVFDCGKKCIGYFCKQNIQISNISNFPTGLKIVIRFF